MSKLPQETWDSLVAETTAIVEGQDMTLWDIEYQPEGGGMVLRLYIDRPDKVTVDDCATISNQVGMMLDVEDLIPDSFTLEVSSPGLDRKLVKPEHYEMYVGRKIHVKLHPRLVGRKKYQGRIERLEENVLLLQDDGERQLHRIPLEDIHTARLEIQL